MQDEITKHTRKIYHAMKEPGHSFWHKVKEVTIEIFIIVFAVTLSIWLHGWSDHRHEQHETSEFLKGLKNDLARDIGILGDNKRAMSGVDSNFQYIRRLYDDKGVDTASEHQLAIHYTYELCTTNANVGRYEGFKSSGKMGTIDNDSLKQLILTYYQQTIPNLRDAEDLINSFQRKILDLQLDRSNNTLLRDVTKSLRMQGLLQLTCSNIEANIRSYEAAIQQARGIVHLIEGAAHE